MNIYSIALFVHVISAIGNFFGNGTLLLCMAALRRAQRVEQVRTIVALTAITRLIFPLIGSILVMAIALVLGLASGLPLARARRDSRRQGLS
jgi:hypothetical protein